MTTPTLQEVLQHVPMERIDQMNEIIPGVAANEKNLNTLFNELIGECLANEYDQSWNFEVKKEHPSCQFTILENEDDERELVIYLEAPVQILENGQKFRYNIDHKTFSCCPHGLLKGIIWAKQSMKRYREEGPCPECEGPNTKKLKIEGFGACFGCVMKKALDL